MQRYIFCHCWSCKPVALPVTSTATYASQLQIEKYFPGTYEKRIAPKIVGFPRTPQHMSNKEVHDCILHAYNHTNVHPNLAHARCFIMPCDVGSTKMERQVCAIDTKSVCLQAVKRAHREIQVLR